MATQVLRNMNNTGTNGTPLGVTYTNNTSQNVRIIINYLVFTTMSWRNGEPNSRPVVISGTSGIFNDPYTPLAPEIIGRNLSTLYYQQNLTQSSPAGIGPNRLNSPVKLKNMALFPPGTFYTTDNYPNFNPAAYPTEIMISNGGIFTANSYAHELLIITES